MGETVHGAPFPVPPLAAECQQALSALPTRHARPSAWVTPMSRGHDAGPSAGETPQDACRPAEAFPIPPSAQRRNRRSVPAVLRPAKSNSNREGMCGAVSGQQPKRVVNVMSVNKKPIATAAHRRAATVATERDPTWALGDAWSCCRPRGALRRAGGEN